MKPRAVALLIPPFFLLMLGQLVGAVYGPAFGVLAALCVGVLAFVFDRLFELHLDRWWMVTILASSASLVGILLPFIGSGGRDSRWGLLLFPAIAGSSACIAAFAGMTGSRRCALCSRRLKEHDSFECPRCGQVVCDQSCWLFQHSRCSHCEQNQVPILSTDFRWWDEQTGPRIRQGRCQLCMAAAENVDLRVCQQCGRPYCRTCWDSANGQCGHCLWTIPGIPVRLEKYISRYDPSQTRSSRMSRTRTTRYGEP